MSKFPTAQPHRPESVSAEQYSRAEQLLQPNLVKKVYRHQVNPVPIPGTDRFWYRINTREGPRFVLVDPLAGTRNEAFDHEAVAKALGKASGKDIEANALPIMRLDFLIEGQIGLHLQDGRYALDLESGAISKNTHGGIKPNEVPSPDGRWAAFSRDHNLFLRNLSTGDERQLTTKGTAERDCGANADECAWNIEMERLGVIKPPVVVWSPDSSKLMSLVMDQSGLQEQWYVESSPAKDGRPALHSKRYPFPGDERVPLADYFIVDIASGKVVDTEVTNDPSAYTSFLQMGWGWFSKDAATAYTMTVDRHWRHAELFEVDTATGRKRSIQVETSKTHLDLNPWFTQHSTRIDNTTATWWSERSGWGHLYRLDVASGKLKNAITEGDWVVNSTLALDEAAGYAWLAGSGREAGDPYQQHLYRARLDGSEVKRLDTEDGHHRLIPTDQGNYFVDTISTMKDLGRTVLRDRDGKIVLELEVAESEDFAALGFRAPERLAVTAADGKTEVWVNVFLPPDLDPTKRYPVLDDSYPGPQINRCPGSLAGAFGSPGISNAASLAALGFIVVQIDGRGTPLRSKAFHDHSYGAIQCGSDLDDHEAALQQLAKQFPMDLERVGIFGGSGGGFASARAMLVKPDFYKAAVSLCGNHDQRIYTSSWGEKFHGPLDEADYVEQSNNTHAANLKGKLLLIHGELDDNVSPSHTLSLVDKLIAVDADFEMFIVPGAGHGLIGKQAFVTRRRWDFFVRHLLGAEPPAGYHLAEPPVDLAALLGG